MTNDKNNDVTIRDLHERQKYAECPECGGDFVLGEGRDVRGAPCFMWACKKDSCTGSGFGYETKQELYRSLIKQNDDYHTA